MFEKTKKFQLSGLLCEVNQEKTRKLVIHPPKKRKSQKSSVDHPAKKADQDTDSENDCESDSDWNSNADSESELENRSLDFSDSAGGELTGPEEEGEGESDVEREGKKGDTAGCEHEKEAEEDEGAEEAEHAEEEELGEVELEEEVGVGEAQEERSEEDEECTAAGNREGGECIYPVLYMVQ